MAFFVYFHILLGFLDYLKQGGFFNFLQIITLCSISVVKHGLNFCHSLEWCLNSPPKPHAFVSLPLQSRFNLNLKFDFSKILHIIVFLCFIMSWSLLESNKAFSSFEYCDAARPWGMYFQDSATPQMEGVVELHDNILFYLVIILFGVGWILLSLFFYYTKDKAAMYHKYLNHETLIESIWTFGPALILILIAFPSFKLLYLMHEVSDPAMSVLAEGHQWYWSYQHTDFLNSDEEFIEFDSYLVPESDLDLCDKAYYDFIVYYYPEIDTNNITSSIKRFFTFDFNYYPSQFQSTTSNIQDYTYCGMIQSEVKLLVSNNGAFETGPDRLPYFLDSDYEDGSITDGNSDLDVGRNLVHNTDILEHDYLGDTVDEFSVRDWYLARVTRYKRVVELLCEKVNDKKEITGNIRVLTDDELYAVNHFLPRAVNYGGNYNNIGPVTRLILKEKAEKLYLITKNRMLSLQRDLVEDPFTQ